MLMSWVGHRSATLPCALAKRQPHKLHTPLGRLMGAQPLGVVAMDFTMLEPSSDGRENVLVITDDVFNKFTIAVPTRNQRVVTVANVLVKEWFNRYGVPQRLHSDNGRNFLVCHHTRVGKNIRHQAFVYHTLSSGRERPVRAFQPDLTRRIADLWFRREATMG